MKTLLIASLFSVTLALTSFGQPPPTSPAKPPGAPPTTAMSPATAPVMSPATAPAMTPAAPAAPGMTASAPGMSPATTAMSPATTTSTTTAPAAGTSPSPNGTPTATATPMSEWDKNFFIYNFNHGGPIMWPILVVSIVALAVVLERIFWWLGRWMRRDPKRIEKVFTAIEVGDVAEASRLSRDSRDPVLRMMWNGLNHQHASLQGALQVAAGIEIKRAGRFLVVMDTLVTLAPLLGLLGTIVGLMKAFGSLGNEELAVVTVTGGIAEALIATACGLGIAIFSLIPFNFFTSRVSNLEFELQTAATNLEVMLEAQNKAGHSEVEIPGTTPTSATRSSI
ncbi:MAG: MotA/TolQ/ExbB proton channel family protein [Verrucomicrobiota bacterium]|nr:MotA/TolQ/ExbB proton channel family protein [Verrucomicrobiota bacterium]